MHKHIIQPGTYYLIFAALIVLTLTTVGLDILVRREYLTLGAWQTPIALLIATVKAMLVILFFMHVWYSSPMTWVVALSSLLWLAILIGYTMTDYVSRPWVDVPGH